MHITEGIITGSAAILYTAAGVGLVGLGAHKMKRFVSECPEKMPLLGMGAAIIFFLSLIPVPAFTGTCSHPCGTPLIAILLGPSIGFALAGASLLLQAAFFAHGGFSTWGANVTSLGFFGCMAGWGAFKLARMVKLPLLWAGFAGGLAGNIMVYLCSGFIVGTTLAQAPLPQYSLSGYLIVIYSAYLPTQLPIALGEMLLTGFALHYAHKQRPEVLVELGVTQAENGPVTHVAPILLFFGLLSWSLLGNTQVAAAEHQTDRKGNAAALSSDTGSGQGSFSGMDEDVNDKLAKEAGIRVRDPLIQTDALGDLWNLLLLGGGAVCGFIVGRWSHLVWGRRKPKEGA